MPFAKGQSGNPGGNTKTRIITDAINLVLREKDKAKARTKARSLADRLVTDAIHGDNAAAQMILDRVEGKVPQAVSGPEGGPVVMEVIRRIVEPDEEI